MARIAGVNLPVNKRVVVSLTYIFGIGRSTAEKICTALEIPVLKRVKDLSDQEVNTIRKYIEGNHVTEGDLRRVVAMNMKRLIDLGCYRGLRHRKGLPCRGQRTHTNAKTRKKRSSPIAGKKK